ncbi:MAG: bis(5'-nucleosyl)-tetraphosphatase (symmetrical) YqeK [Elusimicrobia bacterium]|nr:bis(5'-nucleosyl)-tetraphosphatase (symmetrical) YqeK [Elusimicrobiota bacterium]
MEPSGILILGGSFDPPHEGHAALLEAAARRVRPSTILLVPAFQAPLKGVPSAPPQARVAMLRRLLASLPAPWRERCSLDLHELRSRRKVYTVETLRRLRRSHPRAELHFVVGSDAAAAFGRWREPRALERLAAWWVGARPEAAGKVLPHFRRLPGRFPDVSSTGIRLAIATGRKWKKRVPDRVAAFIRKRRLYGLDMLAKLESMLKKPRFEHTLAVARIAERLAERHGLDRSKAVLAALLHDCGRSLSRGRMVSLARAWRLKAPRLAEIIEHQPKLLHSYLSAELARRRFGVDDPEVLSAIRKHTLAALSMSRLDRLVYVADAVSEDRAHPAAQALRRRAFRDLDAAFDACLRAKLEHASSRRAWIHPISLELWKRTRP